MRIGLGCLVLVLFCSLMAISGCGQNSALAVSGSASIKQLNESYTGVSDFYPTESAARKAAFMDALMQISMFNGVEVMGELNLDLQTKVVNGDNHNTENLHTETSVFTRSFFSASNVQYYSEEHRINKQTKYKAWCYIPFTEKDQDAFLTSLIEGYQTEISPIEKRLPGEQNLMNYLPNLGMVLAFYDNLQKHYQAKFSTPNKFTAFISEHLEMWRRSLNYIYNSLSLDADMDEPNRLVIHFYYKDEPVKLTCAVMEINSLPICEKLIVTQTEKGTLCSIKPLRSGNTTLRIYPEYERFSPYAEVKHFDKAISVKLINRFANCKTGIAIFEKSTQEQLLKASGAVGNLFGILESSSENLKPKQRQALIDSAIKAECMFLVIGEAELTSQRFNPAQGVYVAFPALHLSIIDLATKDIIWQNSYPNKEIEDIRGIGKTEQQARENALSFEAVFGSAVFKEAMENL